MSVPLSLLIFLSLLLNILLMWGNQWLIRWLPRASPVIIRAFFSGASVSPVIHFSGFIFFETNHIGTSSILFLFTVAPGE